MLELTSALKVKILLEIIETSQSNGISIKIVEPVHAPKHGHHPAIKLLDKSNLLGVGLLMGTRVILSLILRNGLLGILILKDLRLDVLGEVDLIVVVLSHDELRLY
jgi:hypothetical protein